MEPSVGVLGPIVAEVDGRVAALGGPQRRAVLAALTVPAGRVIAVDALIDRLWPDDPPASAAKLVQKHVSALRTALGERTIETLGGGYRLSIEPTNVDVVAFEHAAASRAAGTSPERRIEQLRTAERLWRGDPYSGCGEPTFATEERIRLRGLRQQIVTERIGLELELGEASTSIAELGAMTVEHPEDERLAALLMQALYRAGRQVDALRAFRRIDHHLRTALGVDPSPELRELQGRILRHAEDLRLSHPTSGRPSPDPAAGRPTDLPTDVDGPDPSPASAAGVGPTPGEHAGADEEVRSMVVVAAVDPPEGSDPEDVRAAHDLLFADVARIAERVDGRCERSTGGVVLLGLGLPAHDDDPRRGITAAQAILEVRPRARVAVGAGPAVVSLGDGGRFVAGAVLDRIHHLLDRCAPGEHVIDADLVRRTDTADDLRGPFVGRRVELRSVLDAWRRTADDESLRVVEIIGEAGIGKTRLASEIAGALDPPAAHVLEVGFSSADAHGLTGALGPVVARLSQRHHGVDGLLDTLRVSTADHDWLGRRLRALVEPPEEGDVRTTAAELLAAGARLVELLSAQGPVLVVVEDAHWSEDGLGSDLDTVAERLSHAPVVLLITRRPEPALVDLRPDRAAEHVTIRLPPLRPDEVRQLSHELGPSLPATTTDRIAERAAGNPLFLQQYVRMVQDRPDADPGSDSPETVRRVIAARLDHLPPDARELLRAAAVFGRRFTAPQLGRLVGTTPHLPSGFGPLVRAGLLRRRRDEDPEQYEFHHDLVAEVASGQLVRARRIELHRGSVDALAVSPTSGLDDLRLVVRHWRQVIELSAAGGIELDQETLVAAREDLVTAADRFVHVDAALANDTYGLALGLFPAATADRGGILLRLGQLRMDAGDQHAATADLAAAGEIFSALGDRARAGEAAAREARACWYLGVGDRIDELIATALERIEGITDSASATHVLTVAASQRALRGEAAAALDLAGRAEVVAGSSHATVEDRIRLLQVTGQARFDLDDLDGTDDLRRALDLSLEHGYSRLASQGYNNLAELVWPADGPAAAIDLASAGLELTLGRGLLGQAPWHLAQLAELRYDLGRWDEVLDPPERVTARTPLATLTIDQLVARVRFWRGDDGQVDELRAVVERLRTARDRQSLVPALSALVAMHAAIGELASAADLGDELVEVAGEASYNRLREAGDAVRGLVASGNLAAARALVPTDEPIVRRRRLQWETATALVTEADGRWARARRGFETAERGWAAFPHPAEAGHAAAGVARCAHRLDDAGAGAAARDRARRWFSELSAARLVAQLDAPPSRA